jgi:TonB-linked SusC/RagA family outer membrane protein
MLACGSMLAFAQTRTVTGTITDANGLPVPGATVAVKGVKGGTSTDANGKFTIHLSGNALLIVSGIGFETQELRVGESSNVMMVLKQAGSNLSEVVVTALGIRRDKRLLTYSTQEVGGEALVGAKQDNVVNALDGKIAGVQINNSSGMPGSSTRIVIRGVSSLEGNNTALFVIDGVPMDNTEVGNPDGSLGAGGTSNRAIDIDPNIIESITVLKGAAATALYGSDASRGAVLITTKNGQGKNGKPTISASSSYSWINAILPERQYTWAQGSGGQYVNGNIEGNISSTSWGPKIDTLTVNGKPAPFYNPLKMFFQTGHTTDNNVSVSGVTDKSNYVASYSYLKTDGTEPTTNYIRNAFFVKYTTAVSKQFSMTTQFNYIHTDNNRTLDGNSLASPLWTVLSAPVSWNPYPITNPDGSQQIYRAARNNPYWLLANTHLLDKTDRLISAINLTYTPLNWLSVTERLGGDMYNDILTYHENTGIEDGNNYDGRVYTQTIPLLNFNNDLIVHAKKDFSNNFFGDLILGNNILTRYNSNTLTTGLGLSVPGFYNISNASTVTSSYNYYETRKVGFYGQATGEYKKMLTLSLTGRYDGSSLLTQSKQFYTYGSASAGFIFTEALGMANNPILNFGKLRAGYSIVGNDDEVLPYSLSNPYYQAGLNGSLGNISFPYNGQNGFQLTTTYAYPLRDETVKEFETGIETHWFNNRISLDVTYYDKKSTNLLTSGVPISPATGFNAASINAGSIENKGVEVEFGATIVKTRDWNWHVDVNWTKNDNKVLALAPGITYLQFAGFTAPGIFAFANSPYGVIYGTHFLRNAQGQLLLTDQGYQQEAPDLAPIGNVTPDWLGGLTNTLSYKGVLFSFVLDEKKGGKILNLDDYYLSYYGTSKVTENRDGTQVIPGIIQSTGKANTIAIPTNQYYYQNVYSVVNETSVEDGSFFKLRSVSLGYNFTGSLLRNSVFKSLTLNATGTNFILHKNYTGSDPEVSLSGSGNGQGFANFNAPSNRSIVIGLKATF